MKGDYEALEEMESESTGFEGEDFSEREDDKFDEFSGFSGESSYGEWEDNFGAYGEVGLGELEGDQFLGGLWKKVKSVARVAAPILKQIAPIAGRAVGGVVGGPAGLKIGGFIGDTIKNLEGEEFEDHYGDDREDSEDEINATTVPGLTEANDLLAEVLAAEAAESEDEAEAQSLAGGIATQIMNGAPMKIRRATPIIIKRTTCLTRVLRKSSRTRPLIKAIPTIQKSTLATLTRKAAKGKPITPQTVVRTMAKQTTRILSSPKKTAIALVKNDLKRSKLNGKSTRRRPVIIEEDEFI
jgi:hypothetical protein